MIPGIFVEAMVRIAVKSMIHLAHLALMTFVCLDEPLKACVLDW
jgi:hypothetical protein